MRKGIEDVQELSKQYTVRRLDGETTETEDFNLFFDCLEIFIYHIVAPYKQNALKCACVSTEA